MRKLSIVLATAVAAVLLGSEAVHHRSSGRRLGDRPGAGPSEAVVVLGYKNRGERANLVNRYRARAGLRSLRAAPGSRLVLSGGAVAGPVAEAELMARYVRDRLGYRGELLVETESRSTRQNIRNVVPLIEDADRIKIVSDPLHAEKGRAYLWELRPDLARRLVRAQEYRFGELMLLKPVSALIGAVGLRGLTPDRARGAGQGRRARRTAPAAC